jgi:glycosyltransferase involved in cell wall biosynthesis
MPVHNGLPFLRASIESILAQSFGDFEFVIGDDGSDDGTTGLIERKAEDDPRIRLARRPQKSGVAASLNWVVSLARSPIVAIAHADDIARPDRLQRQMDALRDRPNASAVGALSVGVDSQGREVQPPNYWRLTQTSPFAPFAHSSVTMRRKAFEDAGGYRSGADFWEDLDLYWRLLEIGPILVIPKVLSSYRHSAVSIRSREAVERVEDALEVMYRATERYRRGEGHRGLIDAGEVEPGRKIHPRIFVARSWTPVWNRQRPGTLRRLLERGDLRFNRTSLISLAFVTAATISPTLLRLVVQTWTLCLGWCGRLRLRGRSVVEWRTGRVPAEAERTGRAMRP